MTAAMVRDDNLCRAPLRLALPRSCIDRTPAPAPFTAAAVAPLAFDLDAVAPLNACGDAILAADQCTALDGLRACRRDEPVRNPAVRVPSVFIGRTPRETVVNFFANGFINELPTPQQQDRNSRGTQGLNGVNVELGGQRTFGNLVACVRNDNCVPRRLIGPNRTPSRFCATTARGAAAACVEEGWILDAPTPQHRNLNAGRGTGGASLALGNQQTFGDLCIKKRFWGL